MCFGRLIGAATGLEVARGGDHELVEDLKWDEQKKGFQGAIAFTIYILFISMRESYKDININSQTHMVVD